jgi:hypothetical protein
MLQIEKKKGNFILDLNKEEYMVHRFIVTSVDDNGNSLSWGVEYTTSPEIKAHVEGNNELVAEVPLEAIKKDEYIVLLNHRKERASVLIKPNLEVIRPKKYKFKITSKKIDGANLKIKILSKEGDNEIPWNCVYQGQPLHYEITPLKSDKGIHVSIKLVGEILGTFISVIKFKQDSSNNEITLRLRQSNDSVEIIEAD